MKRYLTITACLILALAGLAHAQTSTVISLSVAPEASLTVQGATSLTGGGGAFAAPFTGTTSLTYRIRTTPSTGSGHIQSRVTVDFSGNGPKAANGDLTYTCGSTYVGTPCTAQTAASSLTPVVDFGANAKAEKLGSSEVVTWTVPDDPQFEVANYSATVQYTISVV